MGAKVEGFAKQYETKVQETTAAIEKLSDADWKKVTAAEKWPVGVTAHHVASGHEPIANIVKTLAAGQSVPHFTMQMLDEMNAKHASEHAGCTKAETIALHKQGATKAAAMLRTLSDEQLAWFRSELATDVDQPTLVFGHHPLVVQDSPFPVTASNTRRRSTGRGYPGPAPPTSSAAPQP